MPLSPIVREDIKTIADNISAEAPKLAGKTVLISGGAGFLGKYFLGVFSYLNKHVLTKPVHIISVDNFITGDRDPNFDFSDRNNILDVWGDVTNPIPVRENLDYIIHAAGLASPVYYMKYPLETIESAVTGAKNLLELAIKNKNLQGFLFFSSSEIYGDPDPASVPTPESYHGHVSSIGPRACYDESKRLTETLCTIYHKKYNVPATMVRPFNVFGPGMKHNDRRVIPMFAYQVLNGQPITVHGDGHQTRTFCYITDAMTGFLKTLLIGQAGEAYNIGNPDNEIAMRDLAQTFVNTAHQFGRDDASWQLIPYPENYPAGEPQRRCPDATKAQQHLSYSSQVDFANGLTRFMQWAQTETNYIDTPVAQKVSSQ